MAKGKYEYWLTPEGLLKLEGWARDGLTDEQIATNMGIRRETLYAWCKKYTNISNTLKRGKEVVDREIERALYNNAAGYNYTEKVICTKKEVLYENGKRIKETVEPVVVEVEKHKPGDTTAQIFWLKNRKPDKWRDKQDVQISGELKSEQSKLDDLIRQMRGDG